MTAPVLTIAALECRAAVRLKWIRLLASAFALLSIAAAYSAGAVNELTGADGFARTTMTLIPLVLILAPLGSLILGVSGQTAEPGTDPFLFTQPIGRATILLGRWLGECVALAGAIVVGLGVGGAWIAFGSGTDGVAPFLVFVALAATLAIIFLSIAAAIAASSDKRAAALGLGIFAWFFFVLLYDGIALSAAGWLSGPRGGRLLFASVFANPVDLVRVSALTLAGTRGVLGATGEAWIRFLGGQTAATVAAVVAVVTWAAAPLSVGVMMLRRRDL